MNASGTSHQVKRVAAGSGAGSERKFAVSMSVDIVLEF